MSIWAMAWLFWILFFLVVELIAVFNSRPGDTLSEHVWRYVTRPSRRGPRDRKHQPWYVHLGRIGVFGLGAWLVFHFLVGV